MQSRRSLLAVGLLVLAIFGPLGAQGATDSDVIQPGDYVSSSAGRCTFNFVFDGTGPLAGKVYIGTAAHCTSAIGQPMTALGGPAFGTVVWRGDWDGERNGLMGSQLDFALIEVKPAYVSKISPEVKGHPGVPQGHTGATAPLGTLIRFSGYGMGFEYSAPTREERVGVLVAHGPREWRGEGPIIFGDSGGPVFTDDGRALGVVSGIVAGVVVPPVYNEGPTVHGIVAELATFGFPVALRSAS